MNFATKIAFYKYTDKISIKYSVNNNRRQQKIYGFKILTFAKKFLSSRDFKQFKTKQITILRIYVEPNQENHHP